MSEEVTLCFGCKKPIDFDTEEQRIIEMYPFGSMHEVYFHSDLESDRDSDFEKVGRPSGKPCFREFADSIEGYECG